MNKNHPPRYPQRKRRELRPGLEMALNAIVLASFFAMTWMILVAAGGN